MWPAQQGLGGGYQDVLDGGPLYIRSAPQGGSIFFVGARASGLAPCGVTLRAVLRAPEDGTVVGEEERNVDLAARAGDWPATDVADNTEVANVFFRCLSDAGFAGRPLWLDVTASDAHATATTRATVLPSCAAEGEAAWCHALCTQSIGPHAPPAEPPPDAGSADAGDAGS